MSDTSKPKPREAWLTAMLKLTPEEVHLASFYPAPGTTVEIVWRATCQLWPDVEGRGSTPTIAITNLITTSCKLSSYTKNRAFVGALIDEAVSWIK